MPPVRKRGAWRRRLRIAFWVLLLGVPAVLKIDDMMSRRGANGAGVRVVTVNVGTQPARVAEALAALRPDIVFMQETAGPCAEAGRMLALAVAEGSDQCVLSRWPLTARPVEWPGPWQPPQMMVADHPVHGPLVLVNARLALPHVVAALSGNAWYTAIQRRDQYAVLRRLLADAGPVILCGDLNAFPWEVDLGPRFADAWTRLALGGTFPTWLPAARIDQCWATSDIEVTSARTERVPSDHRAVVVELRARGRR